jgi:hypothetical protein
MTKDNTTKIKIQAVPRINIRPWDDVYFTDLGPKHGEVLYMDSEPKQTIKKISRTHYKKLSTGEILPFSIFDDRKQIHVIKRSMKRLEHLIKANFDSIRDKENAVHMTLTYVGANMTDEEKLMKDFDVFMMRLKREYPSHKLDYIAVAEPHKSGGWHMHVLMKSDQKVLIIPHEKLTLWKRDPENPKKLYKDPETGKNVILGGMWGHGRVTVERLKYADDIGAYYTAYFTNAEVPANRCLAKGSYAEAEVDDGSGQKQKKKFEKGANLKFYPKHMKFYRCSRGIVRPKAEKMMYYDVPEELGEPVKVSSYKVIKSSEDIDFATSELEIKSEKLNFIQREVYKISHPTEFT